MNLFSSFLQNLQNSSYNITEIKNGGISFIIFTLCTIFSIFWYACVYTNSKKGKPTSPPSPPGLPLVGNLPFLDPELHTHFAELSRRYGPIIKLRLGNKIGIVVTSAATAREVLKDQDINFANRDLPAVALATAYGAYNIGSHNYGPQWRMMRKICVTKMLSNTTLDSVYGLRRREVRNTVKYFYSRVGTPIKVGEQMLLTILNVITSMLWGGTVQDSKRGKLGAEFRQAISEITELLATPNISDFYPSLARFDFQGLVKKMKRLSLKFEKIFDTVVDQRLEMDGAGDSAGEECKDFLQFLLRLKDEGDSKTPFTMVHVKALLMDMVVSGTDTTSKSIEFTMAEMMNKPEVMRKAQQELDEVVGEDKIVEESHIHKLPYLHAVMKEILRLHPALPLLVPHCPIETCIVGGYTIPKGCQVFVNVWSIHRDPSVWENPLEFNPERFLKGKWDYSGSDLSYFFFGSGRRICAGIAMAERMFMYSLATLLHSFDWKLPEGVLKVDLTEKFGIVLKLKTPLVAIPTPRLSDPSLYE